MKFCFFMFIMSFKYNIFEDSKYQDYFSNFFNLFRKKLKIIIIVLFLNEYIIIFFNYNKFR